MQHKIIFISHTIGIDRREDMSSIRKIMDTMRKQSRTQKCPEYPIAPYLLVAQTVQAHYELMQYRVSYAERPRAHGGVMPHELHLYGDDVTEDMVAEATASVQCGIPIFIKSALLRGNPLIMSLFSQGACAA